MEQQGGGVVTGLALAGLAGVVLWALTREKRQLSPGPGDGIPGPAEVSGSIVSVRASSPQVFLGQTILNKIAFQNVSVTVSWSGTTKQGSKAIDWPYRLVVHMGHSTFFGWKRATELGFPNTDTFVAEVTGQGPQKTLFGFSAPDDTIGQKWDIRAVLQGRDTTQDGKPDTVKPWKHLIEVDLSPAFVIVPALIDIGGGEIAIAVAQPGGVYSLPGGFAPRDTLSVATQWVGGGYVAGQRPGAYSIDNVWPMEAGRVQEEVPARYGRANQDYAEQAAIRATNRLFGL